MRLKNFLLIALASLVFISCDDSFNPFPQFKQDYGVACILRADTTFQFATLMRSYPNETNAGTQPKFLFEEGADVRIWYSDSVYRLKDTSVFVEGYPDSLKYYFTNRFKIDYDKEIEIQILLPDGKRLTAVSKTPSEIFFSNKSQVLIPPVNTDLIAVFWSVASQDNFYLPQLRIKCETIENGFAKIFYKELPQKYKLVNGIQTPVFPTPSKNPSVVYELGSVSKFLSDYAGSLNNPSDVTIHQKLELEVLTFDTETSRYLSSSNSNIENLSIRFDKVDYTNINGGVGIFGSMVNKKYLKLKFLENYIRSNNFNFLYDL